MAGRGVQTFKKRQREQERKEKAQVKFAKRLERKNTPEGEDADKESAEETELIIVETEDGPEVVSVVRSSRP